MRVPFAAVVESRRRGPELLDPTPESPTVAAEVEGVDVGVPQTELAGLEPISRERVDIDVVA